MAEMNNVPKVFQISLRTLLELTAVAAVAIALFYGRFGTSERYRVISVPSSHTLVPFVLMHDSQTGQTWELQEDRTWKSVAMPPGLGK